MIYIYIVILLFSVNEMQFQVIEESSFMPSASKYIVSGWVKYIVSKQQITYTDSNIEVIIAIQQTNLGTFLPSGIIIDGWHYKGQPRNKSCVREWICDTSVLIFLVKGNYQKQLLSIINYRIETNLKNEC